MRLINKIIRKLASRSLTAPNAIARDLIDVLRVRIRAMPEIRPDQSSNNAERLWLENRASLRRELLDKDPRTFIDFPVIRETMFVDDPPYIADELKALRSSSAWSNRWRPALRESRTIPTPACPYFPESSGNAIHHARHLWQFEQATGLNISQFDTILEFGGGYGGMCRLIHQLGFRGRYFIFDLPEFSALQEFYLRLNDIPVGDFSKSGPGAVFVSKFRMLTELKERVKPDLFMATWSLSETPLDMREKVIHGLCPRNWLFAYQHDYASLDNHTFFSDWSRRSNDWRWETAPVRYLPGSNNYLFGTPALDSKSCRE